MSFQLLNVILQWCEHLNIMYKCFMDLLEMFSSIYTRILRFNLNKTRLLRMYWLFGFPTYHMCVYMTSYLIKPQLPKLFKLLQGESSSYLWRQTKYDARRDIEFSLVGQADAMSGIVIWRHVWRQEANEFSCCNHLLIFGRRGLIFFKWFNLL